jgi:hypothetical protein
MSCELHDVAAALWCEMVKPLRLWIPAVVIGLVSTCFMVLKLKALGVLSFALLWLVIGVGCLFFAERAQAGFAQSARGPRWLEARFPALADWQNKRIQSKTNLYMIRAMGAVTLAVGVFLLWAFFKIFIFGKN